MANNNNGREKIWDDQIWAQIDAAVSEEVSRVRVAQKILPTVKVDGARTVPDEAITANQPVLSIEEGLTRRFIELYAEFTLTPNQGISEATDWTALKLARLAAKALAQAEDRLLFQGPDAFVARQQDPVQVGNPGQQDPVQVGNPGQQDPVQVGNLGVFVSNRNTVQKGMLSISPHKPIPVNTNVQLNAPPPGPYPVSIFGAATAGIATLYGAAQNEKFGLVLHYDLFAGAHSPTAGSLVMVADRINPLVKAGFYPSEALRAPNAAGNETRYGLLVARAGEPTTIYLSQDATTELTQVDAHGVLHFRVFERVQFVTRDVRAFIRLEFQTPAGAVMGGLPADGKDQA